MNQRKFIESRIPRESQIILYKPLFTGDILVGVEYGDKKLCNIYSVVKKKFLSLSWNEKIAACDLDSNIWYKIDRKTSDYIIEKIKKSQNLDAFFIVDKVSTANNNLKIPPCNE